MSIPSLPAPANLQAFDGIERVVADPLRFKARLAIGENAYASLRMINRTRELWDVLGAAGAGAAIAKSSLVASTFFAPSGLLGAMGVGAATTPIGWVAFAALASGGACYGIYRWLGSSKSSRVIEIPRFLNTPLDTLGLVLFDLIAPLALRLAAVDGAVEDAERALLVRHLVDDWGLDAAFVVRAVAVLEPDLGSGTVDEVATELSTFLHANPDCNHAAIAADLVVFLRLLLEAGGPLDAAEEAALATAVAALNRVPDNRLSRAWTGARTQAGRVSGQVGRSVKDAAAWAHEQLPTAEQVKGAANGTAAQWQKTARAAKAAGAWAGERLPTQEQVQAQLRSAADAAAAQLQKSAESAAAWTGDKLPAAVDQVQQAASRSAKLARAGIARIRRRGPG